MIRAGVAAVFVFTQLVLAVPVSLAGQEIGDPVPCCLEPGELSEQEQASIVSQSIKEPSDESETVGSVEVLHEIRPVGKGKGLWDWSDAGQHHDAVVEIFSDAVTRIGVLTATDRSGGF